jgi:hypothetical protein
MSLQQFVEQLVKCVGELKETPRWGTEWVSDDPGMEMIVEKVREAEIDREELGKISTEQLTGQPPAQLRDPIDAPEPHKYQHIFQVSWEALTALIWLCRHVTLHSWTKLFDKDGILEYKLFEQFMSTQPFKFRGLFHIIHPSNPPSRDRRAHMTKHTS